MNKVLYYFVIGTILGWIMEVCFKVFSGQIIFKAGMSTGPFCILYGFGTVVVAEMIGKYIHNSVGVFILSAFALTILELVTGILLDKVFGLQLWNYLDQKFSINQYICWEFILLWGALGVVFVKYFLPMLNNFFTKNDSVLFMTPFYCLVVYIAIDYVISSIRILSEKG